MASFSNQIFEVHTPRGRGTTFVMLENGRDEHIIWGVNMADTGECWWFQNPDIRFVWCETTKTGRRPDQPLPWPTSPPFAGTVPGYWIPPRAQDLAKKALDARHQQGPQGSTQQPG